MPAQPSLGTATMTRATLRRPSKLMLLPAQGMSEDGSLSPASLRRSAKPTLLRDQHLPGELLHQKTAFPSDVFMRHEAACASPTSSPHLDAFAGGQPSSPSSSLHSTHSQMDIYGSQLAATTMRGSFPRQASLYDQPLSGVLQRQQTALPSDTSMQQEATQMPAHTRQPDTDTSAASDKSAKPHPDTARMSQQLLQQQQSVAAATDRGAAAGAEGVKSSTLPRTVSFAAAFPSADAQGSTTAERASDKHKQSTSREDSLAASGLASTKSLTARQLESAGQHTWSTLSRENTTADPGLAVSQSRDRDATLASHQPQTKGCRGSGHRPRSSLKRADSRLKQSGQETPRTPRSLAGPWFEATTHDLPRNKSWAREWLETGVQDVEPTAPEFEQLQQQSLQQSLQLQSLQQQQQLQQSSSHALAQVLPAQQHSLQRDQANMQQQLLQACEHQPITLKTLQQHPQQQPADHTAQVTMQTPQATTRMLSSPNATARSGQDHIAPDIQAMQYDTSNQQLSQRHGRPQSAPEGFLAAAAEAPWAKDVRRLHSARPGSGGSPTARYPPQACRHHLNSHCAYRGCQCYVRQSLVMLLHSFC